MSKDGSQLRLIFSTQSTGLPFFWRLYNVADGLYKINDKGFFVTNRREFEVFETAEESFRTSDVDLIREWEIIHKATQLKHPNREILDAWERRLGDGSLWNALIIDRRMSFPLKAQYRQCYHPRYDHETQLKILEVAIREISLQLDRIEPHAILGLNAVTVYDYIYYLLARYRGIPYMQLKLTRVKNYVSWFTNPFGISPNIEEAYRRFGSFDTPGEADQSALAEAVDFIKSSSRKQLIYEGAVKVPSETTPRKRRSICFRQKFSAWSSRLLLSFRVHEPHYPSLLVSIFQTRILRAVRRRLRTYPFDIVDQEKFIQANRSSYALYPLNTEPEVALLAYGRPYRNQIETVRNLAAALPVGWKLVVKEHPNSIGYRTEGFYRKLKQIPNVLLADARANTSRLTECSELVAVVYGTIGLEAVLKKKPLLVFSKSPYSILPDTMVCYNENPWQLGQDIRSLLHRYKFDEKMVLAYIAAHIRTGVRVNLFTDLLSKSGREGGESGKSLNEQYELLARHTRERISSEHNRIRSSET